MVPLLALCVSLLLLIIPSLIFYKLWWIPQNIQRLMASQGITGPSYTFFHGTTKDIINMKKKQITQAPKIPLPMEQISHDIFPLIQPHFHSWIQLYGNNFLHWIGTQPEIVITDTQLIKEILTNKHATFPKTIAKGYLKKLFGDGLVIAEGQKWSKLRKLANHAFHGECLKDMVPSMIACVETMLQKWTTHQHKEIEVCDEFRLLTSEVISRTAFGSSYLEGRKIFEMVSQLSVLISKNMLNLGFFGFGRKEDEEADKLEQLLRDSIMEMVRKREDEVTSGKAESLGSDFLGSLLKSHHATEDPKSQISAADIVDECKTFYFAGQETTYSLLSWATFLLSIHTHWQDEARKEVFHLFGKQNPDADGLTRLKIVNSILYETLRLYSPVTNIARRIGSRVKLGNYELPAGLKVAIPPQALHRNPEIWGRDAHLFKPERFGEGLAKATNGNPMAFLGFGYGPRACVGLSFTINEAKIALSMILQRYKFTLSSNYVHSPFIVLTVQPQRGLQILLQPL